MNRNESFPAILVSTLSARLGWASLDVSVEEVDQIQVMVSGSEEDTKALRIQCADNLLTVEQPLWGLNLRTLRGEHWMQIVIRLPRSWKGAVDLRTTSAPLKAHGLTGTDLALSTVSGTLSASCMKSITTALRTVSGDVSAEQLEGEQLRLRTLWGDATARSCSFDQVQLHALSGRIDLELIAPFSRLNALAGSGDMRLFTPMNKADVSLHSASGRIHTRGVSIQPDAPEARVTTISGNFEINCSYAATYEEE